MRDDDGHVVRLVGVGLAGILLGLFACLFAAGGCYHGSPPWPGDPTAPPPEVLSRSCTTVEVDSGVEDDAGVAHFRSTVRPCADAGAPR